MNGQGFEEVADRAVRASELIEEIIRLDDLILLHEQFDAHVNETRQYIDRRNEFLEELNNLLHPHHLRVVEDRAA